MNKHQNITQEQLEEMERFLRNEMSSEETKAFSEKLSADVNLKRGISELRLLSLGVQEAFLENKLDDFHKNMKSPASKETKPLANIISLNKWLVAASVLLIMSLSAWWIFSRPAKEEALFTRYFRADPGLISAMGSSDNYKFERAMIDYKTGKYEAAINAWKMLLVSQPLSDTLNYFVGSAYLAKNEAAQAIPYFEKVLGTGNSNFLSDAYWYLGLSLLKEGKNDEAISFIENSVHKDKEALLSELKR